MLQFLRRSYLNLQHVVPTDTLVMHLVVGVIGIAAALVLDESETKQCQPLARDQKLVRTYSLLEAERGAGMSHRTRRPYLGLHQPVIPKNNASRVPEW